MLSSKAQAVLKQLTQSEIETIRKMNLFGKNQFLTERFGNESEKFGISFGLLPLWIKEVLDELGRR
jgi:hypothetical protein